MHSRINPLWIAHSAVIKHRNTTLVPSVHWSILSYILTHTIHSASSSAYSSFASTNQVSFSALVIDHLLISMQSNSAGDASVDPKDGDAGMPWAG
jgi:hypothetical protein